MKRGDIYLVSLDPTHGHEQRGRRPVLIVSADEFNRATGLPVVVPITGGGTFARKLGFSVALSGIKTRGIVRCDQLRTLDLKNRGGRKVDRVTQEILDEIMAKLVTLFV